MARHIPGDIGVSTTGTLSIGQEWRGFQERLGTQVDDIVGFLSALGFNMTANIGTYQLRWCGRASASKPQLTPDHHTFLSQQPVR